MSLTDTEELRLKAIESKLNTFQKAIRNLASKEELKQLLLVKETVEVVLRQIVDETVSMPDLTDTNIINLQQNQFLQWNGYKWVNVDPSEETSYKLGDLLDVTLTNTIDQSFIHYDQATDEWLDISLMRWDTNTGTITMVPADPGVVKVEPDYLNRSEVDNNTLITKGYVDERFALLIPPAPDSFPGGQTLSFTTPSQGTNPRLCSPKDGVAAPDNTNGGTITASPGDLVFRRMSGHTVTTNIIGPVGPGNSGTLTAKGNNADIGSITLTAADESGDYNYLKVISNPDYPAQTPGFWKSFECQVANWASVPSGSGWSRVHIEHSETSATNSVYFLEDDLTSNPVLGNVANTEITETNAPAAGVKTITGVPQYDQNIEFALGTLLLNKVTGETYYGNSDVLSIGTTAKAASWAVNKKDYGDLNVPGGAIPERQIQVYSSDGLTATLESNSGYGEHYLRVKFKNVNGQDQQNLTKKTLLLASGSPSVSQNIDESIGIPVVGLGSDPNNNYAFRIDDTSSEDTPPIADHTLAYDHSVFPPASAAINAGGVLGFNIKDYSAGYLPVGPDLASIGRDVEQYATYAFRRRPISKFDIEFDGPVSGIWVRLPGVTDNTSSLNGWLDMTQSYNGTGNPGDIAGHGNGSVGCALSGVVQLNSNTSQRRTCTFGGLSSNSVADNYILVRIKFIGGQELTQLAFREASN